MSARGGDNTRLIKGAPNEAAGNIHHLVLYSRTASNHQHGTVFNLQDSLHTTRESLHTTRESLRTTTRESLRITTRESLRITARESLRITTRESLRITHGTAFAPPTRDNLQTTNSQQFLSPSRHAGIKQDYSAQPATASTSQPQTSTRATAKQPTSSK